MKSFVFVLLGLLWAGHANKVNPFYQTTCSALNTEVANLESKYGKKYCFFITPSSGSWDNAQVQCQQAGGQLLSDNLGPNGYQYHGEIRQLVNSFYARMWVGLGDRGVEGQFRLTDGTSYDPRYSSNDLYSFIQGEPHDSSGVEDCVEIYFGVGFNDAYCEENFYGLCEVVNYSC